MNRYSSYKDSGVEWESEIPVNWDVFRLKYLGFLYGGLTGKSGNDFKNDENPNNKPFIPYTNIYRNTYISKNHFDYVSIIGDEKQNLVKKFDIFFLMSSETHQDLGKSCILIEDVSELYLNSFCKGFRITSLKVNPLFLNYQLLGKLHRELISVEGKGFTRINLRQEKVSNLPVILPPLHEQEQIVAYLDKKTAIVDALIASKVQKINLLKENRTALINHVITKGLNPNVKYKDSGVEWIGEIPEHWEVKNLKNISEITLGKMLCPNEKEGHLLKPYLRSQNIQINYVKIDDVNEMWFSKNELKKYRLILGDILVNEGGDVGRNCLWRNEIDEVYIQNSVNRVRFSENYNCFFYLYHFHLHHLTGFFNSIVNRVSIPHLTKEKLENVKFIVPTLQEQQEIVKYLDTHTQEIDELISLEEKKIATLKEYRQALISEVVTGKIKVVN